MRKPHFPQLLRLPVMAAPWIGLDGYGNSTVEQTGAAVSCSGGSPHYKAWYEMFPRAPHYFSNPISAGDTFNASVTHVSGSSYKLVISDATKGWTQTVNQSLSGAKDASAEAILEAPGGFPGFPNGVTFINVTVNGHPINFYSPTRLIATGGWTPGPLNASGGFTIKHL